MIAAVSVLAGAAVAVAAHVREGSQRGKLENDVAVVNSAVRMYLANGGTLPRNIGAAELLEKLKTTVSPEQAVQIVGHRGPFLDARVHGRPNGNRVGARAVWDATLSRFSIRPSGDGFVEFYRADEGSMPPPTESRSTGLKHAKESGWVWDFSSAESQAAPRPVDQLPSHPIARTLPNVTMRKLAAPLFSLDGDYYPHHQFPLKLTLTNPNPAGSSRIFFCMGTGGWQAYDDASISVTDGSLATTVTAYAASLNTLEWCDSDSADEVYSTLYFRGLPDINFANPSGEWQLRTNLGPNMKSKHFDWGVAAQGHRLNNALDVAPSAKFAAAPEQLFELGRLSFRNSTTWVGTNASSVELRVNLELEQPSLSEELIFRVRWVTTPNDVRISDFLNADYVWLALSSVRLSTPMSEQAFYLQLFLAAPTVGGATASDEFRVQEGTTSTATVFARFTTAPSTLTLPPETNIDESLRDPSSVGNGHEQAARYLEHP